MFHHFSTSIDAIDLPEKFTYPFCYVPHPLCMIAAEEVKKYLATRNDWQNEIANGKMFGVLVAKNAQDEIGFIAAFSGNLAHSNKHDFFVPPIFDFLQPQDFFKAEERQISKINHQIKELQDSDVYKNLKQSLELEKAKSLLQIEATKAMFDTAKNERNKRREGHLTEKEQADMIKESQFQKAELHRMKKRHEQMVAEFSAKIVSWESQIITLKKERKMRSAVLQRKLFDKFTLLNAKGEERKLFDIFEQYVHAEPPSGAGECAAPKLLQYAYKHHFQPLAMAEFWQGESPKTEIRRNDCYYPACKLKCEPILNFMLQGLNVEENPLLKDTFRNNELEIVFEDEWLIVVNKPAGMLSVPGKNGLTSVAGIMQKKYPDAKVVHRLDMDTSGLLIVAKNLDVYKVLQNQFKNHKIKKTYTALLDGIIENNEGVVSLPLCLDINDRPRQIVNHQLGKKAVTNYNVLERRDKQTLVALYPLTGRTHQLRVHAAHPDGLNAPIHGDGLYGTWADRLYLHATAITFKHPVSGKMITIEKSINF